jgi:hypothetical protein
MLHKVKRRFAVNLATKSQVSIFYIEKHIWLRNYAGDEEKLLKDFSELVEHRKNKRNLKKKIDFLQPGIK